MDGDTRLRLRVLGELAATRDGAEVELGGRRQRAVLAALVVMRDQVVSADRLAACVWGGAAPANTTGAIQAYVSHLRRRLQPEAGARQRDGVIASTGAGYVLRLGPDTVDAWCLEQAVDAAAGMAPAAAVPALEEALGLWRGPPYAEYAGEPWVEAESVRLTELRDVARERLLAARLQLGDAALLVGELEALVADDPLREERWRLLVLALYRVPAPGGRAVRPAPGPRRRWPTSSASTPDPPCARSRPRCSRSHRRWTPRHPRVVAAPAASDAGNAGASVRRPRRP